MKRNADITVPQGDTRRVEFSITDRSGDAAGDPTNLLGKTVRWTLVANSWSDDTLLEFTDADPQLRIDDAEGGVVSLLLDGDETSDTTQSGRHYLYVESADDQWTVATGDFSITT